MTAHSQSREPDFDALRSERKFQPDHFYTGADTPEDEPKLIALVNDTIDDISGMARPLDAEAVRARLRMLGDDVDLFATEDRERTYHYMIRIWRAAGFDEESGLFGMPDDRVLWIP